MQTYSYGKILLGNLLMYAIEIEFGMVSRRFGISVPCIQNSTCKERSFRDLFRIYLKNLNCVAAMAPSP